MIRSANNLLLYYFKYLVKKTRGHIYLFLIAYFSIILSTISLWKVISLRPHFLCILLYYFIVYKIYLLTFPFIILIGIIFDSVFGYTLGLTSIILIISYLLIFNMRKYIITGGAISIWLGFLTFCFTELEIKFLILKVLYGYSFPLNALIETVLTVVLYPIVQSILALLMKKL